MAYKFNPFTGALDDAGSGGSPTNLTDANISASAEIAVSKLADGSARQLLQTDAAGTGVEWTSNVDIPGTLDVTQAATFDSTVSVPLGTVTAPSIYPGSDTNTGFWSPAADTLALSTNGVERVRVANTTTTLSNDLTLADGGTYTTTLQTITPTANRTISLPNATGTVGLVAGSSGQAIWNNAGAYAGVTGSVVDSSGNVTLGGLTTFSGSPTANGTSSLIQSNVSVTGAWRTGASSNNPALLLNPTGTTPSTTWSVSGTGLGVNAPSGFTGNLLDLQVNGTSNLSVTSTGRVIANTAGDNSNPVFGIGSAGMYANSVSGATLVFTTFNTTRAWIGNSGIITRFGLGFSNSGNIASPVIDLLLERDAANTLAQRNSTNAQTFRCYGTYTDGSNYVRAALSSSSTAVTLAAETAGTGADDIPLNLTAAGTGTVKVNSNLEITDAKDIVLATTTGTKIGTATTQKLGFYNATPVVQPAAVANITTTATAGTLPTADGTVTIADAATPTVTELLEYCVELESKLEAALGHLRTLGLIAT